ncbi:hypothetical protein NMG60_11000349 [Bertholletia excelsa]
MAMEEDNDTPYEINSVDVKKLLQPSIICLNKKRKFQAEQAGLPLPKHKCWERSDNPIFDSPTDENLRIQDFNISIIKSKTIGGTIEDELELESGKDSNSFTEDTDSVNSLSGEAKIQSEYPKTYQFDRSSTSSVNWCNGSFKNSLYSLESRSLAKSSADRSQLPHNDFGLPTCLNVDENLLEFGISEDCHSLEHENEIIEHMEKELEDALYSNGPPPSNFVLSSGRWSVNQETPPNTNTLTIDKEFEQYFSMLML